MRISQQFVIFVCGGFVSAVIDVSVMQLLILLGSHYAIAVSVGFTIGLVANYIFHKRLTFKAVGSFATVVRFAIVVFLNYLVTMLFVFVSLHFIDSVMVGKVASLPVVAVNGFFLSRYWIFK